MNSPAFKIASVFILLISLTLSVRSQTVPDGYLVLHRMFDYTDAIRTMKFKMRKVERIEGEMVEQLTAVKLQREPFKIYSRQLEPDEGVEVLYVEGEHGGSAVINPNGFPWINVKLDPRGERMRRGQHHMVLNGGYDHFMDILAFLLEKYGEEAKGKIQNTGTEIFNGRETWKIEITNKDFKYIYYTAKEGETLDRIGERLRLNPYRLKELNPDITSYSDYIGGERLRIPNDYSNFLVLYVDKQTLLPLKFLVFDDEGLYEHFEYLDLEINPEFDKNEFTLDFPEYGF